MKRVELSLRATMLFVAVLLQNAETALYLPGWLMAQRPDFAWPGPAQYAVAAILMTLVAAGVVILGKPRFAGAHGWALAILAGALLMSAAGHVLMSVATLGVMPGAVTGAVLLGPVAIWVLAGLVEERRLSGRGAAIAAGIGVAGVPFAWGAALRLAEWLMA
ncbi:HXXEE domain-containing protein [Rhodovulum tesquicola]|uniref:HXXEE domain-containing protein n=1 Tax=Rhodovulum tesquicola TaxID=540254 RepID=UPI0020985E1F|nr:HXXEE domain-containing protein [Rhodovulum tesquicola]